MYIILVLETVTVFVYLQHGGCRAWFWPWPCWSDTCTSPGQSPARCKIHKVLTKAPNPSVNINDAATHNATCGYDVPLLLYLSIQCLEILEPIQIIQIGPPYKHGQTVLKTKDCCGICWLSAVRDSTESKMNAVRYSSELKFNTARDNAEWS